LWLFFNFWNGIAHHAWMLPVYVVILFNSFD